VGGRPVGGRLRYLKSPSVVTSHPRVLVLPTYISPPASAARFATSAQVGRVTVGTVMNGRAVVAFWDETVSGGLATRSLYVVPANDALTSWDQPKLLVGGQPPPPAPRTASWLDMGNICIAQGCGVAFKLLPCLFACPPAAACRTLSLRRPVHAS
jgi:hypothetical protein